MYKVVKATLLLKKSLRKRVADKEYSKNTVYLQNVHTYKIFSPRTLHCLLLNERYIILLRLILILVVVALLHPSSNPSRKEYGVRYYSQISLDLHDYQLVWIQKN